MKKLDVTDFEVGNSFSDNSRLRLTINNITEETRESLADIANKNGLKSTHGWEGNLTVIGSVQNILSFIEVARDCEMFASQEDYVLTDQVITQHAEDFGRVTTGMIATLQDFAKSR